MIKLELPNLKHKDMYQTMLKQWKSYEDVSDTSPGALFYGGNFEDLLSKVEKYRTDSPTGINSSLFFLTDNKTIIGGIDIRHSINHPNLIKRGGHIGYGISPFYRKKGYATEMLKLGLLEAKKIGIDKVLITCNVNNIGSNKVIQKNGGIFESKITFEGKEINRYWIDL